MTWSSTDILQGLYIAVAIMIIVVLYHVIFIVVDLRKVLRRIEGITEEVEAVIMKPLSMTDKALEWVNGFIEEKARHKKHHQE
ncbi:MAG TPA: hypothetical protein VHA78_04015 [Candidatus Peribacteraceae bacterium]|nr:hypothetical protein [Candidatus Peribacteraceae bacterium]